MLRALAFLVWLVYWGRDGYRRRRPHWTRRSWTRFATAIFVTLALGAVGLGMASGVVLGVYHGMTPLQHGLYFWTMMALSLLSSLAFAVLWSWFALGPPERQFRDSHRRRSAARRLTLR